MLHATDARPGHGTFSRASTLAAPGILAGPTRSKPGAPAGGRASDAPNQNSNLLTLFLCGDVMTGRGVDQVLPHPSDPRLHESFMDSALGYVELAERAHGPIARPVDFAYIWGDALAELERVRPDVRIINLETSVTRSEDWVRKGINYRMRPEHVPCLTAAKIDCCVLANNHVLDWGTSGLVETLETLRKANLKTAGAGRDRAEAEAPAIIELFRERRVALFSFGSVTSGIPPDWAAAEGKPGVNLLEAGRVRKIAASVKRLKRSGDVVVASIHWGPNWGYEIPREQTELAHGLIYEAGVDVVHGHSSHHPKGIEVYREKPILYGCGDFLDDNEGIAGYEQFRNDLVLMYFVTIDPAAGRVVRLEMTPLRIERFQLDRASEVDARWLRDRLARECAKLGTRLEEGADDRFTLGWG